MKKLIFILLISMPVSIMAQNYFPALYISFQPADFGVGIRVDYRVKRLGLYNSISYGNWGIYKKYDVRHHTKFTIGVLIPIRDYHTWKYNFTAGINYHLLGSAIMDNIPVDPKIFNPWSFELGLSVYTTRRFALGVRTDILRWEPCVDLHYKFGRKYL